MEPSRGPKSLVLDVVRLFSERERLKEKDEEGVDMKANVSIILENAVALGVAYVTLFSCRFVFQINPLLKLGGRLSFQSHWVCDMLNEPEEIQG